MRLLVVTATTVHFLVSTREMFQASETEELKIPKQQCVDKSVVSKDPNPLENWTKD